MSWFKKLFSNNREEDIDNRELEEMDDDWNTFTPKSQKVKKEEAQPVTRGFRFPMVSDEEFSKRKMIDSVSAYDERMQNTVYTSFPEEPEEVAKPSYRQTHPTREPRRPRRIVEEQQPVVDTLKRVSERRTRTRIAREPEVEQQPTTFVNESRTSRRQSTPPTPPLVDKSKFGNPKSPFKLTEVPSPVFGFKNRNAESVNPNLIVEKYGKPEDELQKVMSRTARKREEEIQQNSDELAVLPVVEIGNYNDEESNKLENTILEEKTKLYEEELVTATTPVFEYFEDCEEEAKVSETTEEAPVFEYCEDCEEEEAEVFESTEEAPVFEYCEDCEEEEAEVFESTEEAPVFEYCEDCEEEAAEVFESTEEAPVFEYCEDCEEEAKVSETTEEAPVFEYCEDCEEEEAEVFEITEEAPVFEYCEDCEEEEAEVTETTEEAPVFEYCEDCEEEAAEVFESTEETVEANTIEEQPTRAVKIRPFNVLMTKYDKMRWEQQLERERLLAGKTNLGQVAITALDKVAIMPDEVVLTNEVIDEVKSISEDDSSHYLMDDLTLEDEEEVTEETDFEIEEDSYSLAFEEVAVTVEEILEEEEMEEEMIEEEPPYYGFPSIGLLNEPIVYEENEQWLNDREEMLNATFSNFNIGAKVVHRTQGPSVTRFEVQLEPGVKVNKVTNLSDDIQLSLAARDIRIEAPIPGKHTVGIEVPNDSGRPVRISEIINTPEFRESRSPLTSVLGLDIEGKPIVTDLKKMPHGLIAGATGSGKSVCINSILVSLLYKADPTEVKLILIDPKMVELAPYNNIPHLVSPVITDVKAATAALKWAVEEMERRYQLFAHTGVREIGRYNDLVMESKKYNQKLPYIVVVIDELADLMMVAASDVEDAICRIAQKARACGIHLIIATQRPSVDVITGLIKANVPTRIAFSVSSQIDSRTIIDISGAEKLLGRGDMLFLENGSNKAVRLQGTYVTDEEIEAIVNHCKKERTVEYLFQQEDLLKKVEVTEEEDELFFDACEFVVEQQAASASMLQRRFKIGYNRAARLIDMMESYGFISENKGSKPRDVLITMSDLEK